MIIHGKDWCNQVNARLTKLEIEVADARAKANRRRRLMVVEVLAATGWLLAIAQAIASRLAEAAPAVLGVTFRAIMIGCGALTVAGWWL